MPSPDRVEGTRSERASLATILTMVNAIRRALDHPPEMEAQMTAQAKRALSIIEEEARALQQQVMHGLHTNPPLVIYGNPPLRLPKMGRMRVARAVAGAITWAGIMSRNVHEVRYQHVSDGRAYKHLFESNDVQMYAIHRAGKNDVLLTGGSDQPLWEDME